MKYRNEVQLKFLCTIHTHGMYNYDIQDNAEISV